MMNIDGRFWLKKDGESFLGRGRVELLKTIDKTGSIHSAAKELKMSYKAAWDRIDLMNSLSDEPLLIKTIGGKSGGGTTLTPYAYKLIETFEKLDLAHREFMNRFSQAGSDASKLAQILNRTFLTTSARNQLYSTITHIAQNGLYSIVTLKLDETTSLDSIITQKSATSMLLEPSHNVYAIIKSNDVLISNTKGKDKQNSIKGKIISKEIIDDFAEIVFSFGDKLELVSLMRLDEAKELKDECYAIIEPKNILIGV